MRPSKGGMYVDFHAVNKSIINRKKIEERLPFKTIVFVIPGYVRARLFPTEIRFPHLGVITDVYASCGTVGQTATKITVEKCAEADYDVTPQWENVFDTDLTIDAGHKSSKLSIEPYTIIRDLVDKNDHFRVIIQEAGEEASDLTVSIQVEISTEV